MQAFQRKNATRHRVQPVLQIGEKGKQRQADVICYLAITHLTPGDPSPYDFNPVLCRNAQKCSVILYSIYFVLSKAVDTLAQN